MQAETVSSPRLYDSSAICLLVSVFLSSVASTMNVTAVGKLVFDISHRELDLGWLGLAEFAPSLLLVVITGVIADKYDRNKVTAISMAAAGIAVGLLAIAGTGRNANVGAVFAIVVLFGCTRAFYKTTQRSLPADSVAPETVPWLMVRYSAVWQIGSIVGPVMAGLLYVIGTRNPFIVGMVLYFVAAVCALGVRVRADRHGSIGQSNTRNFHAAFDGFRFIRHRPILLGAISLDLFAVLFGGAVALLPAIAEDQLHVGAVGLGWLRAFVGIGAGAVTLFLAWRPLRRHVGRTLFTVVAIFGVFTILLGATSSYVVAAISIAVLSGADAISVFIRGTLVPLATPANMRGRVLALETTFIGASNELGAFESGVVGQAFGAAGAVMLGGVATLIVAALWCVLFPALRDTDEFPVSVRDDV